MEAVTLSLLVMTATFNPTPALAEETDRAPPMMRALLSDLAFMSRSPEVRVILARFPMEALVSLLATAWIPRRPWQMAVAAAGGFSYNGSGGSRSVVVDAAHETGQLGNINQVFGLNVHGNPELVLPAASGSDIDDALSRQSWHQR